MCPLYNKLQREKKPKTTKTAKRNQCEKKERFYVSRETNKTRREKQNINWIQYQEKHKDERKNYKVCLQCGRKI